MSNRRPTMPAVMRRALADCIQFGELKRYGDVWAATKLHLPECGHEDRTIKAMTNDGLVAINSDKAMPTDKGRAEYKAHLKETQA